MSTTLKLKYSLWLSLLFVGVTLTSCRNKGAELINAAEDGNVCKVQQLLKEGVNPNVRNEAGETPLHRAAIYADADVMEILLKHGADPNAKDTRGYTPLDDLATCWDVENPYAAKLLLDYGADFPLPGSTKRECTPGFLLRAAATGGYYDIVERLLKSGIDLELSDGFATPLLHAVNGGWDSDDGKQYKVVKLLLKYGANPNVVYKAAGPALNIAVEENNDSLVSLLLENGADPNNSMECLNHWIRPILIAVRNCNTKIAEILLEHGANPNYHNSFWAPPLNVAVKNNCYAMSFLLLEYGANPQIQDIATGKTALDIAEEKGYAKIVGLIKRYGKHKKSFHR